MKKLIFYITLLLSFSNCTDLIEQNLENESIHVLSPRDSLISSNISQKFYWESSSPNTSARIQIVNPNFNQINFFIVDTLVSGNQFEINLSPNEYEWRIRLENSVYSSEYQYYKIFIDSSDNLNTQKLLISFPSNNQIFTKTDSIFFAWNPIIGALQYEYKVEDFNSQNVQNGVLADTSLLLDSNIVQGTYQINIRGQNTFTNTAFTKLQFVVDTAAPQTPIITFPINNQILNSGLTRLEWNTFSSPVTPEFDSIYFFVNQNSNTILSKHYVGQDTFFDTIISSGMYYWSIKRFDQAGFSSNFSERNRFFVQ
mgnify:CR=1 FL=1